MATVASGKTVTSRTPRCRTRDKTATASRLLTPFQSSEKAKVVLQVGSKISRYSHVPTFVELNVGALVRKLFIVHFFLLKMLVASLLRL